MHRNQERPGERDARLKVHLVLESGTGERIAEIATEQVFTDLFGEHALRTSEKTLRGCLETQVFSPARALIRGHVLKLEERSTPSFQQASPSVEACPQDWPADAETLQALEDKLASISRERRG